MLRVPESAFQLETPGTMGENEKQRVGFYTLLRLPEREGECAELSGCESKKPKKPFSTVRTHVSIDCAGDMNGVSSRVPKESSGLRFGADEGAFVSFS
jgi:hypothetical protein